MNLVNRIDLKTKRILVTGGNGFVGGHLVDFLHQRGCREILAPSRAQCNLTKTAEVGRLFNGYQPHVVIHAAAVVGGIHANQTQPGLFFYRI